VANKVPSVLEFILYCGNLRDDCLLGSGCGREVGEGGSGACLLDVSLGLSGGEAKGAS
jgi:hypothetical protein